VSKLNEMIREFREDIGQSIEGLALLMQLEPDEFARLEEDWIPPDDILKRLCALFEWNYNDIKRLADKTPSVKSKKKELEKPDSSLAEETSAKTKVPQFAKMIQEARMTAGQNTLGIATLLSIAPDYYEEFESGLIPPDDLLRKLCSLYGWNYKQIQQKINSQRPSLQKLELKAESNRSTISALKNALNRLESQKTQIKAKSLEITKGTRKKSDPTAEVKEQLESLLNHSLESEQTLNTLREQLEIIQATLRNYEIDRTNKNAEVNQSREILEKYKLSIRELEVRKEGLDDQLSANGYSYESIKQKVVETLNETELEQELEKILRSMERLGPINLAASNEYEEEAKRKDNLDSQFDDLNRALDTLNGAIKQIDDESMKRFNETFEKVNIGLKKHFPRLFDGGKAYLELEKDDSLDAGVIVMARPPGKRNSNIHLLSGGEKALTAVALLFSIFELNPAPFCLLDEVDAPLDDTNVARFCEIVREMSESVQFVVITHNKTTMELTNQLIGVTMSEPGVSRLVTVDLDEAVALTEESQSA